MDKSQLPKTAAGLLTSLAKGAGIRESMRNIRKFAAITARATPAAVAEAMSGVSTMVGRVEALGAELLTPSSFKNGGAGKFDVCDLRFWLIFAEKAGIPYVPAREILTVTEDDVSLLHGKMNFPDIPVIRKLRKNLGDALNILGVDRDAESANAAPAKTSDSDPDMDRHLELRERLMAAMDDVPGDWMVRHARCSSGTTKAFMATGVGRPKELLEGTDLGRGLKMGPGWHFVGNRRAVDVLDSRVVEVGIVSNPRSQEQVFLARPWVPAARRLVAHDPHRDDTPFEGNGAWPAEWRAYIRNGVVEGVSAYYPWAHPRDVEDVRNALAVRVLAQRVVDAAIAAKAIPVFPDHEMLRGSPAEAALADFPAGGFHATIDFIETPDGLKLLEGGPAYTPIGGGHPCGFAGLKHPEGVAIGLMPGINLADPRTWKESDRTGAILSWEEAENRLVELSLPEAEISQTSTPRFR